MVGLIIIVAIAFVAWLIYADRKKRVKEYQLPPASRQLLLDNVEFYRDLSAEDQTKFESRIRDFLATTSIRGVDVEVEDLDRILIASGAIILIFSFPDWKYNNISEILLYKGSFNHEFETEGANRSVLGMVGDGALHRQMLLSRPSLRASFQKPTDGRNVVIHEFAHLLDKADGTIDGVPDYLLAHPHLMPWVKEIRDKIREMRVGQHKDIDFYGATNDAEFFAVISEYFFERPDKMKTRHPELHSLLEEMFQPQKT